MTRATLSAYAQYMSPRADRQKDDFYPTPPEGTRALLAVETFDGPIWEPACGDGAMSRVLGDAGYSVVSTDLVARGYGTPAVDFLLEHEARAPNIVTNPPFKLAQAFAEHSLRLTTGKVAMLARLTWLEGMARRPFFEASPLARVWVFSGRLCCLPAGMTSGNGGKGGMVPYAWFVWEHGHQGPPQLGWISPDKEGAE